LVGSTDFGRGTTRAEDAQGTPAQNDISPSIRGYEDQGFKFRGFAVQDSEGFRLKIQRVPGLESKV